MHKNPKASVCNARPEQLYSLALGASFACSPAKGDASWRDCKKMSPDDYSRILEDILDTPVEVEKWDGGRFQYVKKLQNAVLNNGQVVQMRDLNNGPTEGDAGCVAVKQMPNSWVLDCAEHFAEVHPRATEKPWRDIGCMRYLNSIKFEHANQLFGVFRDDETTYVSTSLATSGDLFAWCSQGPAPGGQREDMMLPVATQLFAAVKRLHDVGLIHRDLSLENCVLTDDRGEAKLKLIDFGMSTAQRWSTGETCGKRIYQAPEMHTGATVDGYLADAFAAGVALYAMAVADYPWRSTRGAECKCFDFVRDHGLRTFLGKRRLRGAGTAIAEALSEPLLRLLEGLLDLSPGARTTLGEAAWAREGPPRRTSVWESEWIKQPCPDEPCECDAASRVDDGRFSSCSTAASESELQ